MSLEIKNLIITNIFVSQVIVFHFE